MNTTTQPRASGDSQPPSLTSPASAAPQSQAEGVAAGQSGPAMDLSEEEAVGRVMRAVSGCDYVSIHRGRGFYKAKYSPEFGGSSYHVVACRPGPEPTICGIAPTLLGAVESIELR